MRSCDVEWETRNDRDKDQPGAAKVDAAIKASPVSDLERNARQHFVSQLARQGLVTREEFEIQTALLEKTRAKLKVLEIRIAELEAERQSSPIK